MLLQPLLVAVTRFAEDLHQSDIAVNFTAILDRKLVVYDMS